MELSFDHVTYLERLQQVLLHLVTPGPSTTGHHESPEQLKVKSVEPEDLDNLFICRRVTRLVGPEGLLVEPGRHTHLYADESPTSLLPTPTTHLSTFR